MSWTRLSSNMIWTTIAFACTWIRPLFIFDNETINQMNPSRMRNEPIRGSTTSAAPVDKWLELTIGRVELDATN
jgi:hypothetical protein